MREWMRTPSVVVDEQRLMRNVDRMQALATRNGVALRPHAKTHKTVEVARLQLAAGAVGITVSKPSEAVKFLQAHSELPQLKSLLLAYPVVQTDKLVAVIEAAKQAGVALSLTVDSTNGIDAVEQAATATGYPVNVLLHIDVGYHRVGLEEGDPRLLEFAQRVHQSSALNFAGLLSHAGHAYACANAEECSQVAEIERGIVVRIKQSLEQNGIPVPVVSVGSTMTEPARKSFEGITEIRPGNYVFLDRTPVRTGLFNVQDVSLGVLVTVVSSNKYHFIIDSGSKVLSSDAARGTGTFGSSGYGLAFYEKDFDRVVHEPSQNRTVLDDGSELVCFELAKLSEEHGWIKHVEGVPSPAIGQRMVVLPNHACVAANLTDTLYVQGPEPKTWKLISRGCTQ